MSRNLGDPWDEIERLTARIRALEKATMLANASVGGGRLRFYDGGELLIEGGNLRVTGTGSVSGTFNVSGTLNVTGTSNLDGPVIIDGNTTVNGSLGITGPAVLTGDTDINGSLDVNGPTKMTGNTAISGTLAVNGAATLKSDLTVNSAGRIIVTGARGNTIIANSRMTFSNGAFIASDAGTSARLTQGTGTCTVDTGYAYLGGGTQGLEISTAAGFKFSGVPTVADNRVPQGTLKLVGGALRSTTGGPT